MRTRQEMPASVLDRSGCEGILKTGIEAKAWSDECLSIRACLKTDASLLADNAKRQKKERSYE